MYLGRILRKHGVLGFFFFSKVRQFKDWLTLNLEFRDWPALRREGTEGGAVPDWLTFSAVYLSGDIE